MEDINSLTENSYDRRYYSGAFSFKNTSTIATSGFYLFDYFQDNNSTQKYGSFNNCRVTNLSASDIIVYPNQDRNKGIVVPAGQTTTFGEEVAYTSSLLVENLDASNTIMANNIRVSIWKDLRTTESLIANVHKRLLGSDSDGKLKTAVNNMLNRLGVI